MTSTTRFKAHYLYPGSFMSEHNTKLLDATSMTSAIVEATRKAGERAFAFTVAEYPEVPTNIDLTRFDVVPRALATSSTYYLDGMVYTLSEVELLGPDHEILAENMRSNGWAKVIKCRTGNWQPFETGSVNISLSHA